MKWNGWIIVKHVLELDPRSVWLHHDCTAQQASFLQRRNLGREFHSGPATTRKPTGGLAATRSGLQPGEPAGNKHGKLPGVEDRERLNRLAIRCSIGPEPKERESVRWEICGT